MARKKRKVDPAQSAATNHQQELPSSDLNSCGTTYFPITDDPPPPTAEVAAAAAEEEEEDGSDGDDEEDVTKLLELLSREQLVELLRRAAEKSPWTMAAVRRAAEADPASRKLFVHGLAWRVGAQDLRSAFSRFGDLEDCNVILDKQSRKSKGYGFVLFRSRAAALRALRCPQLQIAGRLAICQFAASGPTTPPPKSQNPNDNANSGTPNNVPASSSSSQPDNIQRKIFVGNVHANVDVARLYEYFSQFGEIEEGPFGFDKSTGKPKGFALFVYKSEESARRALEEPMKIFDGKVLNVQKATDGRTKSTPAGSNSNANSSATAASAQMTAPSIAAINPYDLSTYGATAASAQMTTPSIAAINPYDPSTYGATAFQDMAVAQQAAMLGMGAQQQAFVQPNASDNASSGTPNNAHASSSSSQPDYMQRKIFVGNVHADVDVDRLYEYFSQFGEIEEGPLGFDKWTGKPKGFALFFYKSEESARRALEEPMKNFDGKVLNVQKAKDWRTKSAPAGSNSNANSSATAASSQMVVPSIATAASSQMAAPSIAAINPYDPSTYGATAASAQMTAPSIAAINPYDPSTYGATAASAQMTVPSIAATNPYDTSTYGATAVQDMAVAQQAAMLGMSAHQQAFVQPNTAMLAMMAAAMQNPAMLAALNPAFAAMGAGGQHSGIPDFGGQGFGPQGFATGGVNFPPAAGGLQGAAAYQGCLPGFQGTPGFLTSAGFQVGPTASQTDTTAAAAGATGYEAGPAGQGQMPSSQTDFQGGY